MAYRYHDDLAQVASTDLVGFFVGWPNAPTPSTHVRLLERSSQFVVATEPGSSRVIGFVTALTDGVLSAYISHLEVLPEHRGRGVGGELVRQILARLDPIYMVDLICDPEVQPFYEALGLTKYSGMILRNYLAQAGTPGEPPH